MGYVYLLHFDKPYKHAKHYLGFSENDPQAPGGRIEQHENGTGANLTKVLKDNDIGFTVARVWQDVDRNYERKKKNQGGASRMCPICKQKHKNDSNSNTEC